MSFTISQYVLIPDPEKGISAKIIQKEYSSVLDLVQDVDGSDFRSQHVLTSDSEKRTSAKTIQKEYSSCLDLVRDLDRIVFERKIPYEVISPTEIKKRFIPLIPSLPTKEIAEEFLRNIVECMKNGAEILQREVVLFGLFYAPESDGSCLGVRCGKISQDEYNSFVAGIYWSIVKEIFTHTTDDQENFVYGGIIILFLGLHIRSAYKAPGHVANRLSKLVEVIRRRYKVVVTLTDKPENLRATTETVHTALAGFQIAYTLEAPSDANVHCASFATAFVGIGLGAPYNVLMAKKKWSITLKDLATSICGSAASCPMLTSMKLVGTLASSLKVAQHLYPGVFVPLVMIKKSLGMGIKIPNNFNVLVISIIKDSYDLIRSSPQPIVTKEIFDLIMKNIKQQAAKK